MNKKRVAIIITVVVVLLVMIGVTLGLVFGLRGSSSDDSTTTMSPSTATTKTVPPSSSTSRPVTTSSKAPATPTKPPVTSSRPVSTSPVPRSTSSVNQTTTTSAATPPSTLPSVDTTSTTGGSTIPIVSSTQPDVRTTRTATTEATTKASTTGPISMTTIVPTTTTDIKTTTVVPSSSPKPATTSTTAAAPTTSANFNDKIFGDAAFPNGTIIVSYADLAPGADYLAPVQTTYSVFSNFDLRVDNASYIAEAGRLSSFYVLLPQSVTDDYSIGIRFGDSEHVYTFPLQLANLRLSGLRKIGVDKYYNNTALYELQIRMGEDLCRYSEETSCTLMKYSLFTISSTNEASLAPFNNTMPIACGSICLKYASSPCIARCEFDTCAHGGRTVQGQNYYEAPGSRRFVFGTVPGALKFNYNTFTQPDRVVVRAASNNAILFDSECVGTKDMHSTNITFTESEIRVDIEPECLQTNEKSWNFEVFCPYH